jgi:hypothetical protein
MEQIFHQIVDLLDVEIGLYESLMALLIRERDVVSKRTLAALCAIQQEKELLLPKLKEAEAQRQRLLLAAAHEIGISPEDLSLRKLAACAPEAIAEQLMDRGNRISETVQKAVEENRRCREILDLSLNLTRKSVDYIKKLITPRSVYTSNGRAYGKETGGRILSGAA